MDVKEFIAEYNAAEDKEKCIKKHIIKDKYVPYTEKIVRCENIVKTTMYINVDGVDVFKQNTPMQYLGFMLNLIDLYTDIDVDYRDGKGLECFDLLSEKGLIDLFKINMPENEIITWDIVLNMCIDDLIENTRSLTSYFETKISSLDLGISAISEFLNK